MFADRRAASSRVLQVITGLLHLSLGQLHAPLTLGRTVRIVGGKRVSLEAVDSEVRRDLACVRPAVKVEDGTLVDYVVDGLADVDVVKRGDSEIHHDRPQEVTGVNTHLAQPGICAHFLNEPALNLEWRRGEQHEVSLSRVQHRRRIVARWPDNDLDAVEVSGPQRVLRSLPLRIADQGQRLAWPVTAHRQLLIGGHREVEPWAALDHVRSGRHQEAAVPAVGAARDTEWGRGIRRTWRDGGAVRQRET